jgi:hypothetical protein
MSWQLHNLYSSPDVISSIRSKMRWGRNSMHGTEEQHNPEWKTPFERARQRWEDNIYVELEGLGCGLYSSGSG